MTAPQDVREGIRAIGPLLPSLVPFGIITGVIAVNAGIPAELAIAMSSMLYAGASQLAAISLIGTDAPIAVIVFTVLIINLRFTIYSASLVSHFRSFEPHWRFICAYLVSDHSYAVAIPALTSDRVTGRSELWFFLGAAVPPWLVWQASTVLGVTLGPSVPTMWSLGFTIPLAFLGLLFSTLEDRVAGLVAVSAGGVTSVATVLPYNLGIVVGTLFGAGIGVLVTQRMRPDRESEGRE